MKLAVPLSAPGEAKLLHEAGASEFYCGLQTIEWQKMFGNHDSISRRQGRANLSSFDDLNKVVFESGLLGAPIFLTLNGTYTEDQLPLALETAEFFQEMGGDGLMISDISLLLLLKKRKSKLIRGLSLMAAVSNCAAINFYLDLGVSRIVFPRFLSPEQIALMMKNNPHVQAETIILFDKCRFIDGYCRFLHTVGYQDYSGAAKSHINQCLFAYDTTYKLPACSELLGSPAERPACGACFASELDQAGVSIFKIGGRGTPLDVRLSGVRFFAAIRKESSCDNDLEKYHHDAARGAATQFIYKNTKEIKELYRHSFGVCCDEKECYYA